MLKDPKKFRIGFHMAGAEALAVNRMGSEVRCKDEEEIFLHMPHRMFSNPNAMLQCLVTEDGFEESVGVIHLSHFLMFNLLMDAVEKHGRATKTKPRMVIVGSITHNPTELAGKIPPQVCDYYNEAILQARFKSMCPNFLSTGEPR